MAGSENRFERAQLLSAAFDPIIDLCVLLGVHASELESLVRVEFVRRLSATLPPSKKTGAPAHEAIGLAAGLSRNEVHSILSSGAKSGQLRMRKKAAQSSKSDKLIELWKTDPRFISTSGGPLNLPIDKQQEGPSFEELVAEVLPHKNHKNVLKDLRRRGLVQALPDDIVRVLKTAKPLPTELNEAALSLIAEQMRIVGTAIIQSVINPEAAAKSLNMVQTSELMSIPDENIASVRAALREHITSFVQAFEKDLGRNTKRKKGKSTDLMVGTTVFTFSNK